MIYALAAWLFAGLIVKRFSTYREDPNDAGGPLADFTVTAIEVALWPVPLAFRLAE